MKNIEARYELLEKLNVMENFIVDEELHNVKDYVLALIIDEMGLFVVLEQGSGKMRDSLLVIVLPKAKGLAKKWMFIVYRK